MSNPSQTLPLSSFPSLPRLDQGQAQRAVGFPPSSDRGRYSHPFHGLGASFELTKQHITDTFNNISLRRDQKYWGNHHCRCRCSHPWRLRSTCAPKGISGPALKAALSASVRLGTRIPLFSSQIPPFSPSAESLGYSHVSRLLFMCTSLSALSVSSPFNFNVSSRGRIRSE